MKINNPRLAVYPVLVWLFLIAMHMLNISLESVEQGQTPEASAAIKPMHLLLLPLLAFVVVDIRVVYRKICSTLLTPFFFLNALVVSVIHPHIEQISPTILKLGFAAACFLVGLDISQRMTRERFLTAVRIVSWLTLIAIIVKGFLYYAELRAPPTRDGWKPDIPLFFSGGVNIEASMMVLASAFFVGRRSFLPFLAGALFISVMYLSRAATIGCAVPFLVAFVNPLKVSLNRFLVAVVCGVVALLWVFSGDNEFFRSRMTSIGSDSSSSTRLQMLKGVWNAFRNWPLGYGAGNAIVAVEAHQGDFRAGNLHNVLAQILLDYGLQGLLLWLGLIVESLWVFVRTRLASPLGLFVSTYFVLSLVEFTGLESFFWFIFGTFLGFEKENGPHADGGQHNLV